MKRGFLNSAKAKKSIPESPEIVYKKFPEAERKLSYGVVQDRGVPKDYVSKKPVWNQEVDANFTGYKDDAFTITTQPAQPMSATLADVPDGWSECWISGYAKRQILSTPGFPQPLRRPSVKSYEIKQVANKGLGVVATRSIRAGDLIFAERAIIISPSAYGGPSGLPGEYTLEQVRQVGLFERERVLEVLFSRVDPTLQAAYKALYNSHQFDGSGPLTGIARTNGFGINLKDKDTDTSNTVNYTGTFNEGSRFNHSCMANVDRRWDLPTFSMEFRACRDIQAGEELTVTYLFIMNNVADRQKALEPYGFQCTCLACLAPDPAESYHRRLRFLAAFPTPGEWVSWIMDETAPDDHIIRPCLEQLRVCDEEGLHTAQDYVQAYLEVVMICYQMLGDEKNVVKYGEMLGRQVLSETGDDTELKTFRRLNYHRRQASWAVRKTRSPAGFNIKWDHYGKVAEILKIL